MPSVPGCLVFRVPSVPKPFRVPSVPWCLVLRVPSGCQPIYSLTHFQCHIHNGRNEGPPVHEFEKQASPRFGTLLPKMGKLVGIGTKMMG